MKQQLYGHLPPISKMIQIRWTRHAGHCWRSKDELIGDVLQGPFHIDVPMLADQQGLTKNSEMGCNMKDLPGVMDDWD